MFEFPDGLTSRARSYLQKGARKTEREEPPRDVPKRLAKRMRELSEQWGGLQIAHYAFAARVPHQQTAPPVRDVDGEPVGRIATEWSRSPVYVDADGRLYKPERWWPTAPLLPFAESVAVFVERLALADWLTSRPIAAELDRRMAAPLADALGLAAIEGASAGDATWWGPAEGDGLFVGDGQPFAPARPVTSVQGPADQVIRALRTARTVALDVGARVFTCNPQDLNGGHQNPPFDVREPEAAPEVPPLGPRVLPLRACTGLRWEQRILEGVVDVREDAVVRALETHAGRVVQETRWSAAGLTRVRYTLAGDRIAPLVSAHARANLPQEKVAFDPRDVVPAEELEAVLRQVGIEPTDPLLELERKLGGMRFGGDYHGVRFGVWATLRGSLDLEAEGNTPYRTDDDRVDFGIVGDARYLADTQGRLHFVDDIDGTDILVAESAELYLERTLRHGAGLEPSTGPDFAISAYVGEALAVALGAKPIDELSDAAERYWSDGAVLICERPRREGAVQTTVLGASLGVLEHVATVLTEHLADASDEVELTTRFADVRALLQRAGLPVRRQGHETYWDPPETAEARELAERVRDGLIPPAEHAHHSEAIVRRAIAERSDADLDTLRSVVEATGAETNEDVVVLDAAARHPAADAALLERLARRALPDRLSSVLLRAAAMHPSAPPELLDRALADRAPEARHAVALHPEPGPQRIAALCADEDPFVRRAAASHPAAPAQALAPLARDPERWVRLAVAKHPNTPDDTLVVMAADPDSSVAYDLASRPVLPPEIATRVAYHPWALRQHTVAHGSIPIPVLERLARSTDRDTARGIASNAATPPPILERLLSSDEPQVRELALGHPELPEDVVPDELRGRLEEARRAHPLVAPPWKGPPTLSPRVALGPLLDHRSPSKGGWARHPTYPPALLAEQLDHPELLVGLAIAGHPWVPEAVLELLVLHPNRSARVAAVRHPRTPPEAVERGAEDESEAVRAAAASNPRLSARTRDRLAESTDRDVLEAIAGRADCPRSLLEKLAAHPHEYVRRGVASNPEAPPALLERFAADPHLQVRSRLPLNPACPERAVEALLAAPEPIVRDAAVWRLLASRPYDTLVSRR